MDNELGPTLDNIGEITAAFHQLIQFMQERGWRYSHATKLWHYEQGSATMTMEKAAEIMTNGQLPIPF